MEFLKDIHAFEKRSHTNILKYFENLVQSQWYSNDKLKELQENKLRLIIKHSYNNIPYYHNLFKRLDLSPNDIKGFDDLNKIPILTKSEIQENYKKLINKNFKKEDFIQNSTSGSTGEPLEFLMDREMISWQKAIQLRAFKWADYYPWDKFAYFWTFFPENDNNHGRIFDPVYDKYNLILRLSCFNLTDETLENYYNQIINFNPKILLAIPNPLYFFSKFLDKKGYKIENITSVITNAEMLLPFQRELIEEVFNCPVFDIYGAREVSLMIGECPEAHNKHYSMETAIMEIVKDGESVENNEEGELIVTNLTNYAMPFIRYRVGDVAKRKAELCKCGRGLEVIDSLKGRIDDYLITRNGRFIPGIFFPAVFAYHKINGIKQYQIIQKELEEIEILIVKTDKFKDSELIEFKNIIKKSLGDIRININFVDEIPSKSGKCRYTISELDLKLF
ncbi:MAG: hypothetical protein GF329_12650 [Candidatus Lokiarchaeota archaeon]|nr:hypothetical protein [Candidatus Lokiarchaeota archaeon]